MRHVILCVAPFALFLAAGCTGAGPKAAVVKGKLSNNGKSVLPDGRGGVTMVFLPVVESGTTYPATVNSADGTYIVQGPDGKGIPTGKYKVTISLMSMNSTPALQAVNARFGTPATPVEVEVAGDQPLDIDIAKFGAK